MVTPIANTDPNVVQQQVDSQVVTRVQKLEADQVSLRIEMSEERFDQDKLLFSAKKANEKAKEQLKEKEELLHQQTQKINVQTFQITDLEGKLTHVVQEKKTLQAQYREQKILKDQNTRYFQQALETEKKRVADLEEANAKANDELRLPELVAEMEELNARIKYLDCPTINGDEMFLTLFIKGVFRGLMMHNRLLRTESDIIPELEEAKEKRTTAKNEITEICERLGKPLPECCIG
jgi:chromosome segregation ATPase